MLALAGFLVGLFAGAAIAGGHPSTPAAALETVTVTSRFGVTRRGFTTFCQDLESETERKACKAVKDIHAQEL